MKHSPPLIPRELTHRFRDWRVSLAYSYGPETATWCLQREGITRYLKIAPVTWEPSLDREAERMRWAADYLPVPQVLETGVADEMAWLLTAELAGTPATDPRLKGDPAALVSALACGLRAFHETPVQDCPFDFSLDVALAQVRERLARGRIVPERDFHPEHQHLSAPEALENLERHQPPSEIPVLCHGDYCLPNVLLAGGEVCGYLDLGELGRADRWWDLAVATWSVTWNLGPGWEDRFLEAYGIRHDPARVAYFRLLYDIVS